MEKHTAQRNTQVDMLRGIAMLLVVLGHTLSGCTTEYQTSFVYEVIWALQMPLFVLIRGYVTRYSRPASDPVSLLVLLGRRTLAYLLPWTVWTFLVRGLIFGDEGFLDLRHIFYSMDSGYWFLFTIWTISVIFALARFVSSCILRGRGNAAVDTLLVGGFYILGMGLLAVLGKLTDVLQHGPVDVYVFRRNRGSFMAPALKAVFPSVDVAQRRIDVCTEKLQEVAVFED